MAGGVVVYTFGICHCSVCAPKEMPREKVELGADADLPLDWITDGKWPMSRSGRGNLIHAHVRRTATACTI